MNLVSEVSLLRFVFRVLALLFIFLYDSISRTDLDLITAAFSLSRILNIFFKSGASQGVNLLDIQGVHVSQLSIKACWSSFAPLH